MRCKIRFVCVFDLKRVQIILLTVYAFTVQNVALVDWRSGSDFWENIASPENDKNAIPSNYLAAYVCWPNVICVYTYDVWCHDLWFLN